MHLLVHLVLTSIGYSRVMHDIMLVHACVDVGLYVFGSRSKGKCNKAFGLML